MSGLTLAHGMREVRGVAGESLQEQRRQSGLASHDAAGSGEIAVEWLELERPAAHARTAPGRPASTTNRAATATGLSG